MENLDWIQTVRLIRGFVFKSVFGQRPDLCKRLLETILDINILEIELVQPERELNVLHSRRRGSIDLYIVDSAGNRYDVEVQTSFHRNEWLRARWYQALMDADQLKRGVQIEELRDSIVVFICGFDPFKRGLMRYDCATVCLQTNEVVPDRRRSVYLNTQGTLGELTPELNALLHLFAGGPIDNDPFVHDIIEEMRKCVDNPDWMEQFMTLEEEFEAEKQAARESGRAAGYSEGHDAGYSEGRDAGYGEGRDAGYAEGHDAGYGEGRDAGYSEGRDAGCGEGELRAVRQNALLVDALANANRINELADAMRDSSLRKRLLEEFGITDS